MSEEIMATAELGRVFLEFLQTGNGTTLVLILCIGALFLGAYIIRRNDLRLLNGQIDQCRIQHDKCEEDKKQLTVGIWHFLDGDTATAKAIISEQMKP